MKPLMKTITQSRNQNISILSINKGGGIFFRDTETYNNNKMIPIYTKKLKNTKYTNGKNKI